MQAAFSLLRWCSVTHSEYLPEQELPLETATQWIKLTSVRSVAAARFPTPLIPYPIPLSPEPEKAEGPLPITISHRL